MKSAFTSFLRRLRQICTPTRRDGRYPKQGRIRRTSSARLLLELLEDRTLPSATGDLVGWAGLPSNLLRIDPMTGAATVLLSGASISPNLEINGAAALADGEVAFDAYNGQGTNLYRLDPASGAVTDLGRLPLGFAGGLQAAPDGGLVGWAGLPSNLLRIDPMTGAATVLLSGASISPNLEINGAAALADGEVAFDAYNGQGTNLYRLDPASGAVTDLGRLPLGFAGGLQAAPDGGLVGWAGLPSNLLRIDPMTGAATVLLSGASISPNLEINGAAALADGEVAFDAYNGQGTNLYRLDPASGAVTDLGRLPLGFAGGLQAAPTSAAAIVSVTGADDSEGTANVLGDYLAGIPLQNTYTVTINNPGAVSGVDYQFSDGHQSTATRVAGTNQWQFPFDDGTLAANTNSLTVTAYILRMARTETFPRQLLGL